MGEKSLAAPGTRIRVSIALAFQSDTLPPVLSRPLSLNLEERTFDMNVKGTLFPRLNFFYVVCLGQVKKKKIRSKFFATDRAVGFISLFFYSFFLRSLLLLFSLIPSLTHRACAMDWRTRFFGNWVAGRAHSCISIVLVVVKNSYFPTTRWTEKTNAPLVE